MVNDNSGSVLDNNDPLYLHPSDHPGLSLVTEVFDGTNSFNEWKISMRIALSAKNKICFVTGSLVKPSTADGTHNRWERCNDMVKAWLGNGLSKEIKRSIIYIDTAQGIWEDLCIRFGQISGAQLYAVKKELGGMTQGSDSISGYYTKLRTLWDELSSIKSLPNCTCGALAKYIKLEDDERLVHFLMGLNDVYTSVRGSILMMTPLPSVAQGYALVLQEEKQRETKHSSQLAHDSVSMNVVADKSSSSGNSDKKALFSDQINRLLSLIDVAGDKQKSEDDFAGFAGTSFLSQVFNKVSWILDSGASCHMCCDIGLFEEHHTLSKPFVITLPTGEKATVRTVGSVRVLPELTLREVLYVPMFQCNLLSVGKLIRDVSCKVLFTSSRCVLQAPFMRTPLVIGKVCKDLYILETPKPHTGRGEGLAILYLNKPT